MFSINAIRRIKVSCELALKQLNTFLDQQDLNKADYAVQFEARATRYATWREELRSLQSPPEDGVVSVPYLTSRLRQHVPQDTTFVMEAVTNAGLLIHHLNLVKVGRSLTSISLTCLTVYRSLEASLVVVLAVSVGVVVPLLE